MLKKMQGKNAEQFTCENCDFKCSRKSNFNNHLSTQKHILNSSSKEAFNNKNAASIPSVICEPCGKTYKSRVGLWYHIKTCKGITNNDLVEHPLVKKDKIIELLIKENNDIKNVMLEIVKSNSDLQKHFIESSKINTNQIMTNSHNTINSNNKTFNLQFFLNEQCKDAMNMSEFVNSFELTLEDLESVGELGYVDGITKIFVDKLNNMDVYKRPIHCSDAKREIIYIKDDDVWVRELRSNPKLRRAIKSVSFKNMRLASVWSDTYPDSKSSESSLNDVYMKIVIQSTGGSGEISISEDKIIKRIAKEIVIEKK